MAPARFKGNSGSITPFEFALLMGTDGEVRVRGDGTGSGQEESTVRLNAQRSFSCFNTYNQFILR